MPSQRLQLTFGVGRRLGRLARVRRVNSILLEPQLPSCEMADAALNGTFDSLPYYDDDLQTHPHLQQKVEQELARELKKMNQSSLHPKVPPPVELFTVREQNLESLCNDCR